VLNHRAACFFVHSCVTIVLLIEKAFASLSGNRLYEADAKQKMNISIDIQAYPPKPDLMWYKDGQPVHSEDHRLAYLLTLVGKGLV